MTVHGIFYDGKSSDRHPVTITRSGEELHVAGEGIALSYDRRQVRATPPLGRTHRSLLFADGAVCELADDSSVASLLPGKQRFSGILHRWERSLGLAGLALAATILIVWCFVRFGIPVLAHHAAMAIPTAAEKTMGAETLEVLDRMFLEPSRLPAERQEEVRVLFAALQAVIPESGGYRLELRRSDALGANALALPAGIIVVTDAFVELAQHDEEIVAVLAHEFAHVRQRHILRQVLQNSAAGLLVASLTGDLTSITSLAATLPTALVNARYSRRFEMEADDEAVIYLARLGIAPSRLADALERLQAAHDAHAAGEQDQPFGELLSTHPETRKRVDRILGSK